MPRVPIDDLNDPRIAAYRHLKATNQTRGGEHFVVEGEKLLDRLARSRFPVASVLVTDRFEPRLTAPVPEGVPTFVVPHALIAELAGFRYHQGVLACGTRRPWPDLASLAVGPGRRVLVGLPTLDSPENLGAILRVADVFGAAAVLVGPHCPDPLSRRVLRVSMGSAMRVPTLIRDDLAADLGRLQSDWTYQVVATVTDPAAEPFDAAPAPGRLVLLLGPEAEGLGAEWVARCDRRITIPMRPGVDSLNVALAAGIVLHHAIRTGPPSAGPGA